MPDVRPLNEDKHKISKHKFLEVYHFCLQYHEWLEEKDIRGRLINEIAYAVIGVDFGGTKSAHYPHRIYQRI